MVAKVGKTKLMSVKVPVELKEKIDNCRAEYARQGMGISINATIVDMLTREVRRMEKELRKGNPDFEHGQESLDLDK